MIQSNYYVERFTEVVCPTNEFTIAHGIAGQTIQYRLIGQGWARVFLTHPHKVCKGFSGVGPMKYRLLDLGL